MRPWCGVGAFGLAIAGLATPAVSAARAVPAVATPSTPTWTVGSMATPPVTTGQSFAVSCVSSKVCESAGFYLTNGQERPLAEVWNGRTWTTQSVPTPAGATTGYFAGVSCPAVNACSAVGAYAGSAKTPLAILLPLVERWNGTNWSLQVVTTPPNATFVAFNGVSCSAAAACVAVGSYIDKGTGHHLPLAEIWNGTSWAIKSPLSPTGTTLAVLTSVSCTAANSCVAVGGFQFGASEANNTLAEAWNGTSWKIESTPNVAGASVELLYGVQCAKANACTAVGESESGSTYQTLAERWNGSSWKTESTPSPTGTGIAGASVSCASVTSCTAVWQGGTVPVAETWNGTTWVAHSVPAPSGRFAALASVACTAANACTTVGVSSTGATSSTLAERWNGTAWAIQTTPTPSGPSDEEPLGIDCTAANSCTAVGYYDNAAAQQVGLAAFWNGTNWTVENTPTPPSATSVTLSAVSCNGAGACAAVGQYATSAGERLLAERWSGKSWVIENPPIPSGATASALSGVSCTAATVCVAVGHYTIAGGAELTLAENWNGATWQIEATSNPSVSQSLLNSVSCTGATTCMAVGGASSKPLAESLNGTTWTARSTPPQLTVGSSSVSCAATAACTAVGDPTSAFFAQGWNGTTWVAETLAQPAGVNYSDYLSGVSCSASSACTAVGFFFHDYITSPDFLGLGAFTSMVVPVAERYS